MQSDRFILVILIESFICSQVSLSNFDYSCFRVLRQGSMNYNLIELLSLCQTAEYYTQENQGLRVMR
jgi:hypothetical protein